LTKAVDTSIVARFIVQDDMHQAQIAATAFESPVFISLSVVLETIWLLTSRYKLSRAVVGESMLDILDIPGVECEQDALVRWAIDRFQRGAAIGDMLHLVSARHREVFLTFDKKMAKDAGDDSPVRVELLA
jgi:predicted nucleic-acid-binding protein